MAGATTPPLRLASGRYTSYWNADLFMMLLLTCSKCLDFNEHFLPKKGQNITIYFKSYPLWRISASSYLGVILLFPCLFKLTTVLCKEMHVQSCFSSALLFSVNTDVTVTMEGARERGIL